MYLCIQKEKINEQIEDHLNLFSFTWICMGLLIASVFCFIGSKTDTFYEVTFNSMAVFMALYYLYSQYAGARNKKMTFMQWGLLSLFAFINILFIILTPKEMTILIVLTESIITILIENKKST